MPTREGIQHFVDTSEPNGVQPGDEWWNIGTGRYYKRVVFSNGGVGWTEIGQPSLILGAANTWVLTQAFSGGITGTTAAFSGGITATTAAFSGSAASNSMIIGSGRSSSVQAALDVNGQVRAPQYIIGNPISGSSITYGAVTSNQLLPPPTFHNGTGALTSVGTAATGTSPWGVAVDPTGRFAFVTNSGATVQAYTINQSTGALTSVGTAATGGSPQGVAVDPTGRFAFVANYNDATVQSYTINQSTGALTSVGTAGTGSQPYNVAVDPTGRFAFVVNNAVATVQAYTINQSTGALTSVGAVATGNYSRHVAVDPTGRFVFTTSASDATVQAYTINQSTGALTSVGAVATGATPNGVAVDPTGRFAFVANFGSNTVQTYTINQFTGALTSVGAVATGTNPYGVAVDPTGRFVFVGHYTSTIVQAYTINQFTGALTSVGAVTTASSPGVVAVDPTGRFVFVTNQGTNTLQACRINNFAANSGTFQDQLTIGTGNIVSTPAPSAVYVSGQLRAPQYIIGNPVSGSSITYGAATSNNLLPPPTFHNGTGALTSVGTAATGSQPWGVAFDPTGRFAFVANFNSSTVQSYTVDQSTGALTSVGAVATGAFPAGVAVDPTGRFAFVANYGGDTVQAYTINQSTGALTSVGTAATGSQPTGVAVDPTGRFAFVTNQSSTTVQAYTINQSTGALTSVGTAATGTTPYFVAVDPTGRFAFVSNLNGTTVQSYTINQSTGALTSVGTVAAGTNPTGVAVDPTGRFVFVTNQSSTNVQSYTINQFTGALTSVGTAATGSQPWGVAVDSTGKFAFVTNLNGNTVQSYTINQSTGALTSVGAIATGSNPRGAAADPTGRFVFVANNTSATVQIYRINNFAANSGKFQDGLSIGTTALVPSGSAVSLTLPSSTGTLALTSQIADPSTLLSSANTWTNTNIFYGKSYFSTSSDRTTSINTTYGVLIDSYGEIRSNRYIIGNPATNSLTTYSPTSSNNLLLMSGDREAASVPVFVDRTKEVNAYGFSFLSLAMHPSGQWLFVQEQNTNPYYRTYSYKIDQQTGKLSLSTSVNGSFTLPLRPIIDLTGRWFIGATSWSSYAYVKPINMETGAFGTLSSITIAGTYYNKYNAHPTGNYFYGALGTYLSAWQITDAGILSQTQGANTFRSSTNWQASTIDKTGRFIFAINIATNPYQVDTILISAGGSSISYGSSVALSTNATTITQQPDDRYESLCVHPTNKFLYVCTAGTSSSNAINVFSINQSTGVLTQKSATTPLYNGATSAICDLTGKFLYVTNNDPSALYSTGNYLITYKIDAYDGSLTLIGSQLLNSFASTTSSVYNMAIDPTNRFLYISTFSDGVFVFRIGSSTTSSSTFLDSIITGYGDYSSSVSSSFSMRGPIPSGSNISGTNLIISSGASTGTGTGGYISFQTAGSGSSGSAINSTTERMRISSNGDALITGNATIGGSITSANITSSNKITQPNLPFVVNDISRYFDGNTASFPLRKEQSALTSLVTSSGTISSIVSSATQFVVTHSLGSIVPGSYITISGCSTAGYNNAWLVSASTSTTCTVMTPVNLASAPATPGTLSGSLTSIVDSKDVEVILNGQYLDPYVKELRYPWITEWDANGGFKVSGSNLILYNAPVSGDKATVKVTGISQTVQTRRYPFSSATIALGE